ncbi:hypothetical protein DTO271D3_7305 [Paecilomyces variotii]|nr:hypothetical protein DTO169E5_3292 [Paecilomyces variotii]KAJ9312444.1 hypothetical protein DTO271D3_7305 [Paecilomyces variotii]
MSFLNYLCGCFACHGPGCLSKPSVQARPEYNTASIPRHDDYNGSHDGAANEVVMDDGYSAVAPLPRYTPRPVSIQEKTLQLHMRDPPISSDSRPMDEKNPRDFEEPRSPTGSDAGSDASSTISMPSSYGNTSTATRETPPPPYSAHPSPAPSRPISISMQETGAMQFTLYPGVADEPPLSPPPMIHIPQPQPVFRRPEFLHRGVLPENDDVSSHARRHSWESR